jgi:hypothetical protein
VLSPTLTTQVSPSPEYVLVEGRHIQKGPRIVTRKFRPISYQMSDDFYLRQWPLGEDTIRHSYQELSRSILKTIASLNRTSYLIEDFCRRYYLSPHRII